MLGKNHAKMCCAWVSLDNISHISHGCDLSYRMPPIVIPSSGKGEVLQGQPDRQWRKETLSYRSAFPRFERQGSANALQRRAHEPELPKALRPQQRALVGR